jgi:hypothetical protein
MPNGTLQLRNGYTRPPMLGATDVNPIHSAAYYELHDNTQQVLYSQGNVLRLYAVANGSVSTVSTLSNTLSWNGCFANNAFMFGNGVDQKIYDGATLRNIGIPAPTAAEAAAVTVSFSTATTGSWATSDPTLLGYQLFMCYYNPVNGAVGNRMQIGARLQVLAAGGEMVLTGLPNLATYSAEWVKLIGRTGDNGLVPNALIDGSGTWIVVGNTLTTATILDAATDPNSELPTRNGFPPKFNKICWALGRAYAIDENDPSGVMFSESLADVPSGLFVGDPRQSWAASSKVYFPTGERCIALHTQDDQAWVWTRNHLAILTEYQGTDASLGRPAVQWMGTWVGGIATNRAFVKTRHGPFWVSYDMELMSRPVAASYQSGASGPVPVSTDYEAALLARIVNRDSIEMAYLLDPYKDIDCIYIRGLDINGNEVVVVHDFGSGGIGREHVYNVVCNTFVRNPDNVVSMRDTLGQMRLWIGDPNGLFAQLEDGDVDGPNQTYSADCVMLFNAGASAPTIGDIEWFGDADVEISMSKDLRLTLQDLDALDSLEAISVNQNTSLWRAQIEEKLQFMYLRFQLDSHPADGTLARSSPIPGLPLETYGRVYAARPAMGVGRTIGGSNP